MTGKDNLQLTQSISQKGSWNSAYARMISEPLFWILIISGIVRLAYYSALLDTMTYDTTSYINHHANIFKGETDGLRTPVYPYFIKLIGLFGYKNLIGNVITAQVIISFLSVIVFYKIANILFKTTEVVFAASLAYGTMLPVINFDKIVLTESLSVTCSVIFIYLLVSYLQKPASLKAWVMTLYLFFLIMLRPSFVYLLPLMMAFWILRLLVFKRDWKMCLSGLAASVLVVLLISGYSNLNQKNLGFNGISLVTNNNQMTIITKAHLYKKGDDPEISAAIDNNLKLERKDPRAKAPGVNIMLKYAPERIQRFIIRNIKNQPVAYLQNLRDKVIGLQTVNIFTNNAEHKLSFLAFRMENIEYLVFCITFNLLYIFLLADLVLIGVGWKRTKRVPWFKIVLWLLITGQIAVAIMGCYAEYQRLILPAMPGLLLLLFSYADKIFFAIDPNKLRSYPNR